MSVPTAEDTVVAEPTPAELTTWDKRYVWHAFTQMAEYEPLVIERAEGCYLFGMQGQRYLDGVSSLWCNVHGHGHPVLNQAIRDQLDRVAHVTNLGQSNPTTIRLAKRLVEITPDGLEHVFFSDSGATAVEIAIKIAFQYWQQCDSPRPAKTKFLSFGDAYHGDTVGSVAVGGIDLFHKIFRPMLFDVVRVPSPRTYRLPEGVTPASACAYYLTQVENALVAHHDEIAAIVIEPFVQGAAGILTQPEGFYAGVAALAKRYDVLLIADEVATGFGRTGAMFASTAAGVTPDLLCLAKGITGGYLPMAATLATDRVYDAFLGPHESLRTFFHGHTYGGNPLAAAVALASLDLFESEDVIASLEPKVARIADHLARISGHPHVGDVRQCGLMVGIELVADKATATPFPWTDKRGRIACQAATERGVWLRPLGDVVVVMPPLAITEDQIDDLFAAALAGIDIATAPPA